MCFNRLLSVKISRNFVDTSSQEPGDHERGWHTVQRQEQEQELPQGVESHPQAGAGPAASLLLSRIINS